MQLQGDFEGQALFTILQMLCDEQQTGLLKVTNNGDESRVFFQDGTIIYAMSSQKETKLGAILIRAGILTLDQLQSCLKIVRKQKEFLGKILVDEGYVSIEQLREFNQKQVEEVLYNLLFWKNGKFVYRSGRLKLGNMIVSKLVPMKVIMEVARRIDEMSIIKEMIPDENVIFKPSPKMASSAEDIKLTPVEWRLISLVDGMSTVKQLIDKCGYVLFEAYKILFSAALAGIIEISQQAQVPTEGENASKNTEVAAKAESDIFEVTDEQAQVSSEGENDVEDIGIDEKTALFLEEVKKVLTVAIGPVAAIIIKDQFNEWVREGEPVRSRMPGLIELFAKEIDDPQLALDFMDRALSLYEDFAQSSSREEERPEEEQEKSLPEKSDEILKEIQDALAHAIGPVAGIILEESMKRLGATGSLSREQLGDLVDMLREEIGDTKLAKDFTNRLAHCL